MSCTKRPRFLVIRNAIAMGGIPCESLDAATEMAQQTVLRTGESYLVVAIEAEASRDPVPRVIVHYHTPTPNFKPV